ESDEIGALRRQQVAPRQADRLRRSRIASATRVSSTTLHLPEPVRERRADRQGFLSLLQADFLSSTEAAMDSGDGVDVDDRAPMDLKENLGIELVEQLLDRLVDQRLGR